MSNIMLPLTLRDISPGEGFTKIEHLRTDGLPNGVHTGGCWLSPDGTEVWKPMDVRPYANADFVIDSDEVNCLMAMEDVPGFPKNWRIEKAGSVVDKDDSIVTTKWWLIRKKAYLVPDDVQYNFLRKEHIQLIEDAVRELNRRNWEIGDDIQVAIDPASGNPFILDLSAAHHFDSADHILYCNEEARFLKWTDAAGWPGYRELRTRGRHIVTGLVRPDPLNLQGYHDYRHVYASLHRPMSSVWARIDEAVFVHSDEEFECMGQRFAHDIETNILVHSWVVTPELLDEDTINRYELTWAWSPIKQEEIRTSEVTS